MGLGAVYFTYVYVNQIQAGELSLGDGISLIAGYWILAVLLVSVIEFGSYIGAFILAIGENMTDFALNLF